MRIIIAEGSESEHRAEHKVGTEAVRVGRAPQNGFAVPWDRMVSREHAEVVCQGDQLIVQALENARNPLVFEGQPHRKLALQPGDSFRIGSTRFTVGLDSSDVVNDGASDTSPVEQQCFASSDISEIAFGQTALQMEVLESLPQVIESDLSDTDLAARMAEMLLKAVPSAHAAAAVHFEMEMTADTMTDTSIAELTGSSDPAIDVRELLNRAKLANDKSSIRTKIETMRFATRSDFDGRFRPSNRLLKAVQQSRETILYMWGGEGEDSGRFTVSDGLDWAFCCPIPGECNRGWSLYVSGEGGLTFTANDLLGDIRFTALTARLIGSIRQLRSLQARNSKLARFFSPSIVGALSAEDVAPVEGNLSILFCDVRGFSRMSEDSQENLKRLLSRINAALEIMTNGILEHQGAIADFQGDAALGFWGWPSPIVDGPLRACRAALRIRSEFETCAKEPSHPLHGFRVGIGLSHGWAIAGTIGTQDQAHLTVLGHVVNLGARLEGLTKPFGVSILMDVATAQFVRQHLPRTEGVVRKIGRVRPAGMETATTIYELIPTSVLDLTPDEVAQHDEAVDAFTDGDWDKAKQLLNPLPESDLSRRFLLDYMGQHARDEGWDGIITFTNK